MVQLPWWIEALVYANPVSYQLDLMRYFLLGFQQLPLVADLLVTFLLPFVVAALAAVSMARMYKG